MDRHLWVLHYLTYISYSCVTFRLIIFHLLKKYRRLITYYLVAYVIMSSFNEEER